MASIRIPEVVPSPNQDCETLYKAFQGWGTDEKALILVLGRRNASQRKMINDTYLRLYNKSLIDDLHADLSGDFRNAIILWTYDPPERDARIINESLKSKSLWKKGVQLVAEVACVSSPRHLMAVRQAYCSLYACSLEEDIASNIPLPLRKLLLGLVSSYRYDKEMVDPEVAEMEADHLHEAIKAKRLDHNYVVWILSTRSSCQLRETFAAYKQQYSTSIDQDIEKCGNGDLQTLLRVVILCKECPEKHFAKVIRGSVVGLGTDEDTLSRAIVSRAEVDMEKIKIEYTRMYKSTVEGDVIGDTSGYYKDFLLTLLGEDI